MKSKTTRTPTRQKSPDTAAHPESGGRPSYGRFSLGLLIFTGGTAIMGIEIAGARMLAPTFGTSVYVWGSIISVFMMALALGYWLGGRIADAVPSFALLNALVLVAGAWTVSVPFWVYAVCQAMLDLGERWGPFFACIIVYLVPTGLMAMVSPFGVRLAARRLAEMGGLAGRLYALSTVGSIVGSLITTFVLIDLVDLQRVFLLIGAAVGLVTGANLLLALRGPRKAASVAGMVVVGGGIALMFAPMPHARDLSGYDILLDRDTPYHRVTVVSGENAQLGVDEVALLFDQFKESGIQGPPDYLTTAPYTDSFFLAFLFHREPESALFIGAGGGLGPRMYRAWSPEMEIDVVDIDATVLRVCHEYFHLPTEEQDPRMHTFCEDGRIFFSRHPDRMYDVIVLDAFTIGGRIPWHLTTREYFATLERHLRRGGVLVMNVISAIEGRYSEVYQAIARTMGTQFSTVYCFPVIRDAFDEDRTGGHNIILVATKTPEPYPRELLLESAREVDRNPRKKTATPVVDLVEHLEPMLAGDGEGQWLPEGTTAGIILRDAYCPIETMPLMPRTRQR